MKFDNKMASKNSGGQDLSDLLLRYGLDAGYWCNVLEKEMHITMVRQLHFMDQKEKKKLEKKRKHDWEIKAWKELFDSLAENNESPFKEKVSDLAVRFMPRSTPHGVSLSDENDDGITGGLGNLSLLSTIAPEKWAAKDLVERSSGGSLMNGVLWTNVSISEKGQLVDVPSGVKTLTPSMRAGDRSSEFDNKTQYETYNKILEILGSTEAEKLANCHQIYRSIGSDSARTGKEPNKPNPVPRERNMYMTRVVSTVVPLAAARIAASQLSLTLEAMLALQEIENNFAETKLSMLLDKIDSFFNRFGSHINSGLIHFGGIYQVIATFDNRTTADKSEIRRMLSTNSESSGLGSSGRYQNGQDMKQELSRKREMANIAIMDVPIGGPPSASNLKEWKESIALKENKAYWRVIDRGDLAKDFTGVWEIIPNHEFQHPKGLALLIQYEWHRRFNSPDRTNFTVGSEDSANEFVQLMTQGIIQKINDAVERNSDVIRRYFLKLQERFKFCEECLGDPTLAFESIKHIFSGLKSLQREVKLQELQSLQENIKEIIEGKKEQRDITTVGNIGELAEADKSHTLSQQLNGKPLSLKFINNKLYCCCKDEGFVTVLDLELNSKVVVVEIENPHDLVEIGSGEIVVAAAAGLYSLMPEGIYTVKKKEHATGHYSGVSFHDGHVYAVKRDESGRHVIQVFKYHPTFKWQHRRWDPPLNCEQNCNGKVTLVVNSDAIYATCDRNENIQILVRNGGQRQVRVSKGMSICYDDKHGSILMTSSSRRRLLSLSYSD